MIAFYIEGRYELPDGGCREWCYDPDAPAFVTRWRRWATDDWEEYAFAIPENAGIGLLNALAHAHPVHALRVAEHLQEHGPRVAALTEKAPQ